MKKLLTTTASVLAGLTISFNLLAGSNVQLDRANTDIRDQKSLQNGAQLFMDYCSGCHSISFMRYNRIAEDLFLDDIVEAYKQAKTNLLTNKPLSATDFQALSNAVDNSVKNIKQAKESLGKLSDSQIEKNLSKATDRMVEKNLVFNADKVGSPIISSMPKKGAEAWFGTTPPDLSLVARSKGTDWIYTYLRSFYKDDSRPFGVNNKVLTNVSMPDVLWHLKESKSTKDFNQDVRDITNFLDYVGEPAKLVRVDLGYKVLGFLFILFILSYLLKKEYWRDVKYGKWKAKD
ncbi:Ubiquinol-cytochrome C reductase, cytochrome C1 subunit [uncultured Gammaproteobacteria bacterium]|nr:Ubiquinol-cytochrome C reductase, cytochrome C1 subunit [Bathymodiolus brooksi thiotrophic gill symbiont]CAB9544593.1 Ubiquinol-cytochrome C reductase, cytochrome C1 subunit [Bathymodiolus brooksi thiotrophic gill symbiont]CAC9609495.1 Ubiquinol-cytochrome C reductase, cytochrome C1 subunit [uncultured Gammaproteobacteria bacterium]